MTEAGALNICLRHKPFWILNQSGFLGVALSTIELSASQVILHIAAALIWNFTNPYCQKILLQNAILFNHLQNLILTPPMPVLSIQEKP
jgi:hypothetical protein